jgi:hypothetical protein
VKDVFTVHNLLQLNSAVRTTDVAETIVAAATTTKLITRETTETKTEAATITAETSTEQNRTEQKYATFLKQTNKTNKLRSP